jgi:hypothetical protein
MKCNHCGTRIIKAGKKEKGADGLIRNYCTNECYKEMLKNAEAADLERKFKAS